MLNEPESCVMESLLENRCGLKHHQGNSNAWENERSNSHD